MEPLPSATICPAALYRERETGPDDGPTAKRTKVEGEGYDGIGCKLPELLTTTTESPALFGAATAPAILASANTGSGITEFQQKFIQKSLTSLKRKHYSRFYRQPVDWIEWKIPHYLHVIKEPMDLGTIEKKLKSHAYLSLQSIFHDFDLMVNNSFVFNGPDHQVFQEGDKLRQMFHEQMLSLPKDEEVEHKNLNKLKEEAPTPRRELRASTKSTFADTASPECAPIALGSEMIPIISEISSVTKPKKSYQWELKFCQEALGELYKFRHQMKAYPFYEPVDPVALNIPAYPVIVKKPMDLSTIKKKLNTGQFENSSEFETDVRLMFKNCYLFNLPGDPTYECGKSLEDVFDRKWAQKQAYLARHGKGLAQNTGSSDEDSDGDTESDEDEQLRKLQRMITKISRLVERIAQKRQKNKGTLLGEGKGTKANVTKVDSKRTSSNKVQYPNKVTKSETTRFVTIDEKHEICNKIAALPTEKMKMALQIVQANVPRLKNTAQTEIELDVDDLPNEVLLMLLRFVKRNAPQIVDDVHGAPASPHVSATTHMQKFQTNRPGNNIFRSTGGGGGPPKSMPSGGTINPSENESDDDSEESEED